MNIIAKIILLLIGLYFAIFGAMIDKIIPVVFGLYIVFYIIYGG